MKWQIKDSSASFVVDLPDSVGSGRNFRVRVGEQVFECSWHAMSKTLTITTPHGPMHLSARNVQKERFPGDAETKLRLEYWHPERHSVAVLQLNAQAYAPGSENRIGQNRSTKNLLRAPMTGKILSLLIKQGDSVEQGQVLLIVEAMKMENKIYASYNGKVDKLKVVVGQAVSVGQEMLTIEPS